MIWVYVSIPVLAAAIGYVTKLVAIRMMFLPLEYQGKRPFGWQGIVPAHAARMASIAVDMMTSQLISPADVVRRLDPDRIARRIAEPLHEVAADLTGRIAAELRPELWHSLPEPVRRLVLRRIEAEAPKLAASVLRAVQDDVSAVFDLRDMVVTNLVRDKALLNRIFTESGGREFRFITHAGLVFGAAIGVVQLVAWVLFREPLLMPFFGAVTGWFTDWLALKMVFCPTEPKRYLGLVTWQGLFLRRRDEVTEAYATLIAQEVITPRKVIEAVLHGPLADRLFVLIQREVQTALARQIGPVRPLMLFAVGTRRYQRMKHLVAERVLERLPETLSHIEDYARDTMDIRNLLITKMRELSATEFEGLLRPAFQADEWILITVGAVLGCAVGEVQSLVLEHFAR
ncbi:MAG TPA: DUF445 domain-containing protein [Pseudonocardiaceae bacterium]|nr:DUF445 domain-containing protein [Pseudonocardiaceae bacterium]